MSLSEFIDRFGSEAQCEQALEQCRWPNGFACPECGGREHAHFRADGRQYWQCSKCRTQSTVCSGTLFHASKLPLTKWFQASDLVTQNKNNISALSLKRHLGVSYSNAWRVKHKLFEAMRQRETRRLLTGLVFADDAVLGGAHAGKPGRGSENKSPFMAAVELDANGHPGYVRFDALSDYKGCDLRRLGEVGTRPQRTPGHRWLRQFQCRRRPGLCARRQHRRQPQVQQVGAVSVGQHLYLQRQERHHRHLPLF